VHPSCQTLGRSECIQFYNRAPLSTCQNHCRCQFREQLSLNRCLTPPLASGAFAHQWCHVEPLPRPPKASNTTHRSWPPTVCSLFDFKPNRAPIARSLRSKSPFAVQVGCQTRVCGGSLIPGTKAQGSVSSPSRGILYPCKACCTAQDCGLTLPSRGQLPGYALQLPLMSNVRRHKRTSRAS
jgi:hypothetical protein